MKNKLTDPSIARQIASFNNIPAGKITFPVKMVPHIEQNMNKILGKYKIEEEGIDRLIMKNWQNIMGGKFAHRCSPDKITKDGVLLVRMGSSALKSELQFQKRNILKKIQSVVGEQEIKDIHFHF
jgi:hypothetical protein